MTDATRARLADLAAVARRLALLLDGDPAAAGLLVARLAVAADDAASKLEQFEAAITAALAVPPAPKRGN
jgi:hypothetical protein